MEENIKKWHDQINEYEEHGQSKQCIALQQNTRHNDDPIRRSSDAINYFGENPIIGDVVLEKPERHCSLSSSKM